MNPTGKNGSNPSLCWDCGNSTKPSVCPWVRNFKPVPGWTAKKTTVRGISAMMDSFNVISCPLFKRDSFNGGMVENLFGEKGSPAHIDTDDAKNLACAIIERYVEDWKQLDYGQLKDLCIGASHVYRDHVLKFFASQWFGDLLSIAAPDIEPPEVWKALRIQKSMLEGVKMNGKPVGRPNR